MARGAASKQIVIDKILSTFDGAFLYNGGKEIRIPIQENGEIIQIKCVLTASKTNVEADGGASTSATLNPIADNTMPFAEITKEEAAQVDNIIERLGL